MTPEQRVMLDHTVNSARAVTNTTANGPFNVLLRSPEIGDLVQQLGNSIRFASGLTPAQRELATLAAGRAGRRGTSGTHTRAMPRTPAFPLP